MTRARTLVPAVALAAYGAFEVASGVAPGVGEVPGDQAVGVVAAVVGGGAVALRRRLPLAGLLVATCAQVAESLLTVPAEGLAPLLSGLVLVFAVGSRCPQRWAITGLVLAVAAMGAALGDPVFFAVVYAVPWLAGRVLGDRQRELDDVTATSEEQTRAAVRQERARIARELHDVVSHALTLVVVQAQVAEVSVRTDPEAAERSLVAVKEAGQQALADMRLLLGVLDPEPEPGASRLPQPGLSEVPGLLDSVRAAGLRVDYAEQGERRALAPGASLTAYRVVQEGLTNVLQHACAGSVEVSLAWSAHSVVVGVRDDGPGGRARPGGGRGLVGLRERVEVCGGTLTAGHAAGGGYALEAVLPA